MQEKLREVAQGLGLLYYHTYSSKRSEPGWPDTVLLHPGGGTLYLVELKSATGVVSAPQRRWLDALAHVTQVVAGTYFPGDWATLMTALARETAQAAP